jgi:uncharacterized protein YqeY
MASLNEQINSGWKDAMRAGDAVRKDTLSMLRAAVKRAEIDTRGSGKSFSAESDDDVRAVIEREAKKRRDAIDEYEKVDRPDRAQAERDELQVLQEFLPEPMSTDELRAIVKAAVASTGASSAKDVGAVMKAVLPRVAGRADGKAVNALVREELA